MDTLSALGWIFPAAALVMAAAVVAGVRSSGRERRVSDLERRLHERTFTGAAHVRLEWPKDRRRPTLARLAAIGEDQGYRLVGRAEREHVRVLDFERIVVDDEL